jgi:hypothetical protein
MLNFAERTGSGAVMLVWSFPKLRDTLEFNYKQQTYILIMFMAMGDEWWLVGDEWTMNGHATPKSTITNLN